MKIESHDLRYEINNEKNPEENLEKMHQLLNELKGNDEIRKNFSFLYEFLEISSVPLFDGPKKIKEGYLAKRTGGRYKENLCQIYCGVMCKRWLQRWFIVTLEGIIYSINSDSSQLREMLLFDQSFQIFYGRKATGTSKGITLITSNRKLVLKAYDFFEAIDWISSILEAISSCPYIQTNRFFSFAPVRESSNEATWHIDGDSYMKDVYDSLNLAKKEIFITDWWLSPEIHLIRPVKDMESETRLDKVLKKLAESGVKIYVLIYSEVRFALYNDSLYTKKALESLHSNIKVIRHPKEMIFLWSHHEKMVIIDQSIGFLGGIDLCYGRFDTNNHDLFEPDENNGLLFPGIDYNNARLEDFKDVKNFTFCSLDKSSTPRMPWHDIGVKVIGDAVRDLARHFIQYWNFASLDTNPEKNSDFLAPKHKHLESNEEKVLPKIKPSPLENFKSKMFKFLHLDKKVGTINRKDTKEPVSTKLKSNFDDYLKSKLEKSKNQDSLDTPALNTDMGRLDNSVADEKPNLENIISKLRGEINHTSKIAKKEKPELEMNLVLK